jgi:hypothetical protein
MSFHSLPYIMLFINRERSRSLVVIVFGVAAGGTVVA